MPLLELKNINKSFDGQQILKDISLSVEDGEFVVFVGPSGCGKSTILRVIAGLEDPDEGEVYLNGSLVNHVPPSKRGIAIVFQTYALYPHLNVRKNMELGLKKAGIPRNIIDQKIAGAAKMLELESYLDRRPAQLSGGQRQRVAIGRAIVREPGAFLFDEPLSNLDAALRINTRLEIAKLHRELNASIIYVTHDQIEAMTLADRIVVLRAGVVEQTGSPLELYNKPDNIFVAEFIGSPAMNILDAATMNIRGAMSVGIRPEHLRIASRGKLKGSISQVEQLGSDTIVYVRVADDKLVTIRMSGQHGLEIGAKVSLSWDKEHLYLFDGQGKAI